jgi:ascorbate-specific PTS system EIIC-type component UlaA
MAAMGSTSGGRGGLGPMHGTLADLGVSVASYPTYAQAQRAVDYLSDNQFPVDRVAIVGSDLSLVEKVLGRMTVAKSALTGTLTGAWFGLFIGLMFGLFSRRSWWEVVFTGLVIGAIWGAIFGALAHGATKGVRDFVSRSSLAAGSYEVMVRSDSAEQARTMLANLPTQ